MEDEEDNFGHDLIESTSFYSAEHEKTKLNWFCYELSLNFELAIKHKLGKKIEAKKMNIAPCLMNFQIKSCGRLEF
jgi:hypothetical protein